MSREPKPDDIVYVRFPSSGHTWIEARVTKIEDRMFYAVPTGDPIVGWLGENVVVKGFENEVGTGGYNTWSWIPIPSEPPVLPVDELASLRAALAAAEARANNIEALTRALLARLSHDYGDSEDCPQEVEKLFALGDELLPLA